MATLNNTVITCYKRVFVWTCSWRVQRTLQLFTCTTQLDTA